MHKHSAILFDLGGTLLYPDFPFLAGQLRQRGYQVSLDRFLDALSLASNWMDAYMQLHATNDASRVPVYLTYLLEGRLPLLGRLRGRCRLAMISNSDGRAEAKAAQWGIRPYLEFVIDLHLVRVEKPDPRIFHPACRQLDFQPADCLYVGDIYSIDVLGAQAAGLQPVLIDRTGTPRTDCRVIRNVFALENMK
jgi:putative hydrolase of the HAD superfamily